MLPKKQRGTFERIFWPIDPRKRPDARHFVWLVLVHPPCQSLFVENKGLILYLIRSGRVGNSLSEKNFPGNSWSGKVLPAYRSSRPPHRPSRAATGAQPATHD